MNYDILDPNGWYRFSYISKEGIIKNTMGKQEQKYLLRLKYSGKLKTIGDNGELLIKNWGTAKKPLWMIKGKEVIRFIK